MVGFLPAILAGSLAAFLAWVVNRYLVNLLGRTGCFCLSACRRRDLKDLFGLNL